MSKVDDAVACMTEGFTCSQAILSTYGPMFGLDRETALKIATPFGGGMACLGHTCGAVTGAFMVIGLKHGRTTVEDLETKEKAYRLVTEFADRFERRNNTIICRELLDCDISTPEGIALARERELFTTLCPRLVRDAAEIIEEILE